MGLLDRMSVDEKSLCFKFKNLITLNAIKEFENGQIKNSDNVNNIFEGLFGKGLAHTAQGLPETDELEKLKDAIKSGAQSNFDALTLGGVRKLANPQASMGFEVMGPDPTTFNMPAPPAFGTREAAAEMVEVYEMALLRGTSFDDIENEVGADTTRAIATLNAFGSDYKGFKIGGSVDGKSLFRAGLKGAEEGPYVSQFLYKDVKFGPHTIQQKYGVEQGNYGITFNNWLEIQKGNIPVLQQALGTAKYINNGRVLGSVVHGDFVYQLFLYAGLILNSNGASKDSAFASTSNEGAFVTNGGVADWSTNLAKLAHNALSSAWNQKWRNHLRLRPETMAGRVVSDMDSATSYVHADILTDGINTVNAVKAYNLANGGEDKAFLPLIYAEGSPTHPSYPAGHAVVSGALTTLLKIYFDGTQPISVLGDVEHSIDGDTLVNYAGDTSSMTVNSELNKLASNVARGRDIAGVHYLTDGYEGMILGEKIAISYFKQIKSEYHETVGAFTLEKFDGSTITI